MKTFLSLFLILNLSFFDLINSKTFALLEFPDFSSQNKIQNENTFLQNLVNKINFGNENFSSQNKIIPTQNANAQIPSFETPKFELPKIENTFTNPFDTKNYFSTSNNFVAPNVNLIQENNVKSELEKKVCDALIKKGIIFKENTPCVGGIIQNNSNDNNSPQNQKSIDNNLQNVYGKNPYNPTQNWSGNDYGFSACQFAQNKNLCQKELEIACVNAYEEGSYFTPECSHISKNAYTGANFGSREKYGLEEFLNDARTNNMQSFLQGDKSYGNPGVLGGENYSNLSGSDFAISGVATQYGCMNNRPDNFLISTYRYTTAFGQKARYGTNVGDFTNSCNFNYCGVAVSLPFINRVYGNKNNAKNQPVKIVNKANLKCVIAPIQDISSIKTWTHKGSNAITDLSQCAMEKIGASGKAYVALSPLKKGESTEGCTVLK